MGGCLSIGRDPYRGRLDDAGNRSAVRLDADTLNEHNRSQRASEERGQRASQESDREAAQTIRRESIDKVDMLQAILDSRSFRSAGEVRRYVSQFMGPPGHTPIAHDHVIKTLSPPLQNVVWKKMAQFDESPDISLDSRDGSPRPSRTTSAAPHRCSEESIPESRNEGKDV